MFPLLCKLCKVSSYPSVALLNTKFQRLFALIERDHRNVKFGGSYIELEMLIRLNSLETSRMEFWSVFARQISFDDGRLGT